MSGFRRLGSDAEDRAANFLLSLGYTLLGRRIKMTSGELDLVALDGEHVVFVEVKQSDTVAPEERLDDRKASRVMEAAEEFARANGLEKRPFRFDLIAIQKGDLRHHKDAFRS